MVSPFLQYPAESEHIPYFGKYIAYVQPGEDVLKILDEQPGELKAFLAGLSEERAGYRYEAGKWNVREVVGHLVDAERILSFRAYCFARGEAQPLHGVDFESYATQGEYDRRTLADLLGEFENLRRGTVAMSRVFGEDVLSRGGLADGEGISVRALLFILAGHVRYHTALLRDRYGLENPENLS